MPIKVAINGFGSIGRSILRAGLANSRIQFVSINDTAERHNPRYLLYLLRQDARRGRFRGTAEIKDGGMEVNGKFIACYAQSGPEGLPWRELGVNYVIESSDRLTSATSAARHLQAGAKRVLITAPTRTPQVVPTFVPGVNLHQFHQVTDPIISLGNSTLQCVTLLAKVVHDNFGLLHGSVTDLRATSAASDGGHKDDASQSNKAHTNRLTPDLNDPAAGIEMVMSALHGKFSGVTVRVPASDVSLLEMIVRTERPATREAVLDAFQSASKDQLSKVLGYTEDAVVSTDFRDSSYTTIFDARAGAQVNGDMLRVLGWYDNEWGFASRAVDMVLFMAQADGLS